MKRMQLLQPQMKAIQEKYKEDPVKMNKKVMEFMKEHKVSPLGRLFAHGASNSSLLRLLSDDSKRD